MEKELVLDALGPLSVDGLDDGDDVEDPNGLACLQNRHALAEKAIPSTSTGTLLPGPMASAVSLFTRSASLALRIGTTVSGFGLGAAKVTTLSSLEVWRGILDGILIRAGRDVFVGSPSDLARADAESILEANLESMHQTMSRLVFWTAASFHAAGTAVSTTSEISQLLLSALDQFFGSTDSSRAIASIITLIRREFQNPATGVEGERVGLIDLILGLCGLAYLQNRCRKMIQEESRRLGYEEIIWDVIVLDSGERVDALDDGFRNANDAIGDIEYHGSRRSSTDSEEDSLLEDQLRKQIAKSLPEDAKISITTSATTIKTITVDITAASDLSIPSFPNLGLVSSEVTDTHLPSRNSQRPASHYRVVYKRRNRVQSILEDTWDDSKRPNPAVDLHSDDDQQSVSPTSPDVQKIGPSLPASPTSTHPTAISSIMEHRNGSNEDASTRPRPLHDEPSGYGNGPLKEVSVPNSPGDTNGRAANQKRTRAPLDSPRRNTESLTIQIPFSSVSARPANRKSYKKPDANMPKARDKKTGIRGVLGKGLVPTLSNLSRESSSENIVGTKVKPNTKPAWNSSTSAQTRSSSTLPRNAVPDRTSSIVPNRENPRSLHRETPKSFNSRDLGSFGNSEKHKSPLLSPAFPTGKRRRSSLVSLTDTISVHSYDSRPSSPYHRHSETIVNGNSVNQRQAHGGVQGVQSPERLRRPAVPRTHTPSIYTIGTGGSETSLVVSSFHTKSVYGDLAALESLRRCGAASGMFPDFHFLRNITRYSRYASAVYGYNFLNLMGISKDRPAQNIADEIHYDVRSFAHHAKLPPNSIRLASFTDPQGGSDSTGATDTGVPLVHTVALDEESKAVVLTCRGTLGFEDVLADMMCDYDDLTWRGKIYKVHKGIHASARRLLYGADGRVLVTIKTALDQNPGYGLVLCGHSLGGAVTALLGVMLAEPSATGAGFLTSATQQLKLLEEDGAPRSPTHICLPSGRPIHVYAYGPPAIMSPSLQKATRGLITSTVHGNDLVPYLSLGVLHDFQALALAFKTDNNEAKAEIKRRVWEELRSGLANRWYSNSAKQSNEDDENWDYVALKTLRVSMMNSKLLPPGEVFKIDTALVMRRDAFTQETLDEIGKPAKRIVLKYIRDVEAHFREVHFGSSMLTDHSPGRYEDALRRLMLGVVEIS
ncbi:hypothetical protein F5B22DRAFT_560256 [Xylaria bambusicola]|uniref:uncharacterized protein n=1 Tax=Xylaria bambusicola TaxID=326684 RepID=UPI002007ED2D|nr:uncharacterized protein F5B22DRAFT_560256 [Xylaria bambusicola]KAI0503216.1 hypothetical protein F5B22DRAFT_560256 [Xylaria bambusicola]